MKPTGALWGAALLRIEAARRLIEGRDRTGCFTSAFQFWWVMWREGKAVFAREPRLLASYLAGPFDPADPYRHVPDRPTVTEEGHQISEWRLELGDMRDFVARRAAQYVPA